MNTDKEFSIVAKTSYGLEEILAQELKELGVEKCTIGNRAVSFEGTKEMLYKANIWLRTANRILVPFKNFKIESADDLYMKIKSIEWTDIFRLNQTFAIDSTVSSDLFNHTKFAALKAKDAIADNFRIKFGKRPSVDTGSPDIRINLHINNNNECTVSLDSSGDPLFKRGYRDSRSIAPIKEDLAAGLILLSGWDKKSTFVDLCCGSGTLLIEAAMIAYNIPPNLNRPVFGFMNWKNFDADLFEDVYDEAESGHVDFKHKIIGVDIDSRVLGMSRANIKAAHLTKEIKVVRSDFSDFEAPESSGVIIVNPPYGERIGENVDELYKSFGDNLKARYHGWNAWVISSNMTALKRIGLTPSQKIKLFNGKLECRFMKYEMYKGTKRVFEDKK